MLSWNFLPMLPPGSCAFSTSASLPWHFEHVASRLAWLVARRGILRALDVVGAVAVGARGAARVLPSVRALPWTVPRYSATAFSWQPAQSTGFSLPGCTVLASAASTWHSTQVSCISPWTEALYAGASTPIELALVVLGRLVGVAHQAGVVAGRRRGQELAAREGAGHHEDEEEQAANGNRHGVPCTSTKIAGVFREPLRKCRAIRCRGSHIPRCDRLTQVNLTHAARPGSVGQTPEQPYDAYGNRMRPNGVSPADRSALAGRGHDDAVRFDDARLRRSTRRRTRRLCLRPPREASGIRFIPPAARAPRAGRRTTRSSFRWQD